MVTIAMLKYDGKFRYWIFEIKYLESYISHWIRQIEEKKIKYEAAYQMQLG